MSLNIKIQPTFKEKYIVLDTPFNIEFTRNMFPEKMLALFLGREFKGTLSKDITDDIFVFRYDEYKINFENKKYVEIARNPQCNGNKPYYYESVLENEYNEHLLKNKTNKTSIFNISKLNKLIEKSKLSEQEKIKKSKDINIGILHNNLNKYFDNMEKQINDLSEQGKWHLVKWIEMNVYIGDNDEESSYEDLVEINFDFQTSDSYEFYRNKLQQYGPEIDNKYYIFQQTIEYVKYVFPETHIETYILDDYNAEIMIKF